LNNFEELGLSHDLVRVLPELGFVVPTEIQKEAIPLLIKNNSDFIGLANTGTGKTAAFGLPLLDNVDYSRNDTQALILAPTRELGQQIAHQLIAFAKFVKNARITVVYGGANISTQIKELKSGAQIVVATPGRLIDLLKRKALRLDTIKNVILDEADEMLNMGFKEDLDHILSHTPEEKFTWLFSATMPQEIKKIIKNYMVDPLEVSVHTGVMVNENIDHQFVLVKSSDKTEALSRFITMDPEFRGIVFCRTKVETQALCNELMTLGVKAEALHGDLNQKQRDIVMKRFKMHQVQVLIATDVAARGIDVNNLTHVIHHTLPDDLSYYTHRSGRTARAGKEGISLALLERKGVERMKMLERKLKISFHEIGIPDETELVNARIQRWADSLMEEVDEASVDNKIIQRLLPMFNHISKEMLIKKLIAKELKGVRIDKKIEQKSFAKSDKKRDSKRKSEGSKNRSGEKLFINLGLIDGFDKHDLAKYISRQSKLDSESIKQVKLFERHSFIEVEHKYRDRIVHSFKNQKYKGHKLRVNLE